MQLFYPVRFSYSWALISLLITSLIFQLLLILKSGELLHDDGLEFFTYSSRVYSRFAELDFRSAFSTRAYSHWGCILFGTIPFFLKTSWLTPQQTSGIFFALPHVLNIFLIFKIALSFKLNRRQALIAAFLYTFSFSNIYMIRDVTPTNLSLTFFLLGILTTLTSYKSRFTLFGIGSYYFLCFFTYYGYWTLAFIGLLFTAIHESRSIKQFFTKGFVSGMGFVFPLAVFFGIGAYFGVNYLKHFVGFGKSINMGSFDEGYSLPFYFFYYAEGPLAITWLICILAALKNHLYVVRCNLLGIALLYALLVVGSNVLEYFVVYGRLVKAGVPMLCLLSAYVLSKLDNRLLGVLFFAILLHFVYNTHALYRVRIYFDVEKVHKQLLAQPLPDDHYLTLQLACEPELAACGPILDKKCTVVYSSLAPENLKFFQYSGASPEDRKIARDHKVYLQISDCPKSINNTVK